MRRADDSFAAVALRVVKIGQRAVALADRDPGYAVADLVDDSHRLAADARGQAAEIERIAALREAHVTP